MTSVQHKVHSSLWWVVGAIAGTTGLAFLFFADNPVRNAFLLSIRTPQSILDAVQSVDPEHSPELQPGANGGSTWCNRFLYLVLRKLGITLPWGTYGTRVNELISYIDAGNDGWYPVSSAQEAQQIALQGGIVVATYYNMTPGESGHAALVLPIAGEVQIAQAGGKNFSRGSIARGFGDIHPTFYGHA